LTDAYGLRTTFMALAVPMILIGLISVALPSLRELDRPSEHDSELRSHP
jgi:hypothetical protein